MARAECESIADRQRDVSVVVFRVVIDGKRIGQLWRKYERRADAQAACARLRALGMDARVVAPETRPTARDRSRGDPL
jgi:hypothetical protein